MCQVRETQGLERHRTLTNESPMYSLLVQMLDLEQRHRLSNADRDQSIAKQHAGSYCHRVIDEDTEGIRAVAIDRAKLGSIESRSARDARVVLAFVF